jgi:hypothetical protein
MTRHENKFATFHAEQTYKGDGSKSGIRWMVSAMPLLLYIGKEKK